MNSTKDSLPKKISKTEWRAKKNERREKQRLSNITRAKSMHAIRLAKPNNLKQKKLKLPEKYYIGCSGWFYWHWRKNFYASKPNPSEWFNHYSRHFKTVELNAPFYSWPTLATVKTWLRQIKKKPFVYTVKVSELITHIKRFSRTQDLIKDFDIIADELGQAMGCFLYQLPPSFSYTPGRLKRILKQLNPTRRNVVEFRHASWWNKDVYKALRQAKVIFCSTSSPKLPDELIKTADEIYIRFHGTSQWYRHDYSKKEISAWVERIKKSKAKRVWAYFNNDNEGYAIKNAKELIRQLNK